MIVSEQLSGMSIRIYLIVSYELRSKHEDFFVGTLFIGESIKRGLRDVVCRHHRDSTILSSRNDLIVFFDARTPICGQVFC